MASRIEINVERMLDRGPKFGFLEVQVSFEEQGSPAKGISFAHVIVPLPKAEVGKLTFDEIRAMALAKARSFIEACAKNTEVCQ